MAETITEEMATTKQDQCRQRIVEQERPSSTRVLLRPLPYPDADWLVPVVETIKRNPWTQ
jgi:hypothetical protein